MPLAIDDPAPTFSWRLEAEGARGAKAACTLAVKPAAPGGELEEVLSAPGNATQFVQSAFNSSTGCNETLSVLRLTGTTLATKTIEALGRSRGAAFRGALTELDLTSALIGPRGAFALVDVKTGEEGTDGKKRKWAAEGSGRMLQGP